MYLIGDRFLQIGVSIHNHIFPCGGAVILVCSAIGNTLSLEAISKAPTVSISALGRGVQSSKYFMYVCGWPSHPVLILSQIEHFGIASVRYAFSCQTVIRASNEINGTLFVIGNDQPPMCFYSLGFSVHHDLRRLFRRCFRSSILRNKRLS